MVLAGSEQPPTLRFERQGVRAQSDRQRNAPSPPEANDGEWERHHEHETGSWNPELIPVPSGRARPPAQRLSLCAVLCSSTKVLRQDVMTLKCLLQRSLSRT